MNRPPARLVGITGETRLYAIIGHPVAQVRPPMTFNPLFGAAGMNAVIPGRHMLEGQVAAIAAFFGIGSA